MSWAELKTTDKNGGALFSYTYGLDPKNKVKVNIPNAD